MKIIRSKKTIGWLNNRTNFNPPKLYSTLGKKGLTTLMPVLYLGEKGQIAPSTLGAPSLYLYHISVPREK